MPEIAICGKTVQPGRKEYHWIDVGQMADGAPIRIPLVIANGASSGPTLYIQAAVHGEEIMGTEILRNLYWDLDPKDLSGCLLAVPIANYPAYLNKSRANPLEERAPLYLHGVFPGDPKGYLTERIAAVIHNEILLKSNYFIDLHVGVIGACLNPIAYIWPASDKHGTLKVTEGLARSLGTNVIHYSSEEDVQAFSKKYGSAFEQTIWGQAWAHKIPFVLFEMGEGLRISEEYLPIGVEGLRNTMKHLSMLKGELKKLQEPEKYTKIAMPRGNYGGGLLHYKVKLGDHVKKGDLLAEITDPFRKVEEVSATADGIVIRILTTHVVYPGAEIAWIATR